MNKHTLANDPDFTTVKESVRTLVDHGNDAVGAIKTHVSEVADHARDTGSTVRHEAAKYIEANPGKSVAIAFGIGYVAMLIRTSNLFPIAALAGIAYVVKKKLG